MLCFVKKAVERIMPYMLMTHTKDVERFRSVQEFYSLKASQIIKVCVSSHDIAKEPL